MNYDEAKQYVKPFEVPTDIENQVNTQIKRGERHIQVYTTSYSRSFAEDIAKYYRKQGFATARIVDIYNRRTGQRGGNYLSIDID
jgi:hypothetical protein